MVSYTFSHKTSFDSVTLYRGAETEEVKRFLDDVRRGRVEATVSPFKDSESFRFYAKHLSVDFEERFSVEIVGFETEQTMREWLGEKFKRMAVRMENVRICMEN